MRVYPRTCGGTTGTEQPEAAWPGLSPHVRGNHRDRAARSSLAGSIPARAGEPPTHRRGCPRATVYPRTCGGTAKRLGDQHTDHGLSPHVRGNHRRGFAPGPSGGSIPARAGEPLSARRPRSSCRVYPRTCGGTSESTKHLHPHPGLSPHVRGNPRPGRGRGDDGGSIPARAGEPPTSGSIRAGSRVYPRTCGGTATTVSPASSSMGLSPHVRGNLFPLDCRVADVGVYPRTCGGTAIGSAANAGVSGLSPHVRGNQVRDMQGPTALGSIPARAGEPAAAARYCWMSRVYPRTCGGTATCISSTEPRSGLSPHVRGNRGQRPRGDRPARSIPARAGEPRHSGASAPSSWVYPRTCGGTEYRACQPLFG